MINKSGFISTLRLKVSGDKGWYVAPVCSYCEAKDKMGVLLEGYGEVQPHFHCFKCGKAGSLRQLAIKIGKPELVSGEYEAPMDIGMSLDSAIIESPLPECHPPIGFRRTFSDTYLDGRGISKEQYIKYRFGRTRLHPKISNEYVILLIEEDRRCVGYVARSERTKEWIDEYNSTHDVEYLRYQNSENDFNSIVFGIDDIVVGLTTRVVVVEGAYDKLAVDRKLDLYNPRNGNSSMKCVCTFGTKFSDRQASKIAAKGITDIVILYDEGTVNKSKKVGSTAMSYFKSVKIGSIVGGDPDEVSPEEIYRSIRDAKSAIDFSVTELETDIEL